MTNVTPQEPAGHRRVPRRDQGFRQRHPKRRSVSRIPEGVLLVNVIIDGIYRSAGRPRSRASRSRPSETIWIPAPVFRSAPGARRKLVLHGASFPAREPDSSRFSSEGDQGFTDRSRTSALPPCQSMVVWHVQLKSTRDRTPLFLRARVPRRIKDQADATGAERALRDRAMAVAARKPDSAAVMLAWPKATRSLIATISGLSDSAGARMVEGEGLYTVPARSSSTR